MLCPCDQILESDWLSCTRYAAPNSRGRATHNPDETYSRIAVEPPSVSVNHLQMNTPNSQQCLAKTIIDHTPLIPRSASKVLQKLLIQKLFVINLEEILLIRSHPPKN